MSRPALAGPLPGTVRGGRGSVRQPPPERRGRLRATSCPLRPFLIGPALTARFRKLLRDLADTFWLAPGLTALVGALAGVGLVFLDRNGVVPDWLIQSAWLYNGGGTGARTLLGAVALSTIGVAGMVFSITIAALSLAAGQMGPRLLRNFTQDRGN